ncbi:hypothetical protein DERF_002702 [Dermatophagoides farinae]|uniref:Uncharacterized protein n=1 Tax=Dermatophagoides farinae TaxID=6954 RepID=A0A922LAV7_DERFA|nr:hypothetical protein DERF_002702 [Dermatophagoides farinae]
MILPNSTTTNYHTVSMNTRNTHNPTNTHINIEHILIYHLPGLQFHQVYQFITIINQYQSLL